MLSVTGSPLEIRLSLADPLQKVGVFPLVCNCCWDVSRRGSQVWLKRWHQDLHMTVMGRKQRGWRKKPRMEEKKCVFERGVDSQEKKIKKWGKINEGRGKSRE